jgi:hypothetical protein
VESAVELFAALLDDPFPDEVTKFSANYFPNQSGVVEVGNDVWYAGYVVEGQDILIARLYLWSKLTDDPMQYGVEL